MLRTRFSNSNFCDQIELSRCIKLQQSRKFCVVLHIISPTNCYNKNTDSFQWKKLRMIYIFRQDRFVKFEWMELNEKRPIYRAENVLIKCKTEPMFTGFGSRQSSSAHCRQWLQYLDEQWTQDCTKCNRLHHATAVKRNEANKHWQHNATLAKQKRAFPCCG